MTITQTRPALGAFLYFGTATVLGLYFTFAAVQGQFGLFNRVQVQAEVAVLEERRAAMATELAALENRTRRLSDEYLDIDLLDERARFVLGLMRSDDLVIR
jgi:cell division protein FtsB